MSFNDGTTFGLISTTCTGWEQNPFWINWLSSPFSLPKLLSNTDDVSLLRRACWDGNFWATPERSWYFRNGRVAKHKHDYWAINEHVCAGSGCRLPRCLFSAKIVFSSLFSFLRERPVRWLNVLRRTNFSGFFLVFTSHLPRGIKF